MCRRSFFLKKMLKGRIFYYYFDYGFHLLFKSHFMFDIKNFFRSHVFQTKQDDILLYLDQKFSFRWLYWWTFFLQHFFYLLQSKKGQNIFWGRSCTKKGSKNYSKQKNRYNFRVCIAKGRIDKLKIHPAKHFSVGWLK